jgi:hypothetical protein
LHAARRSNWPSWRRAARPASAFLSEQSFGYCPRAKRSRSNTRASIVGYLF